jgi:hypothetical protein
MVDFDDIPDTEPGPTASARYERDAVVDDLGADDVQVLVRIAQRLRRGAESYGALDIAADNRAFRSQEAREELEDALVYLACAWLKSEGQGS